ncbi:hypothetical protein TD95_003649 [Thielaviopsis punctulata]|uniref:DUF6699 domain-containing protein n=1 Tax=Thielaviopsis punctulata TaxID=72032 RepID=A0A0F4Z7U3_9PEZI|nr:hypothetical protein TD95_003649 [Thielaviopsis punctulata]
MSETLAPLQKVDSAIEGLEHHDHPHKEHHHHKHRRASSSVSGVFNINDLERDHTELTLPIETQKTGWKINTSPNSIEEPSILKLHLVSPPVKKIDLHFPLGMEVTARNMKGVTIKDAMDAIYKAYKKRSDDELDLPYLAGFEWDKEECWTRLIVHLQKNPGKAAPSTQKKKSKKSKSGENE